MNMNFTATTRGPGMHHIRGWMGPRVGMDIFKDEKTFPLSGNQSVIPVNISIGLSLE
jgi:hypothetical protein